MAAVTFTAAQVAVASVVLNIQWRHVLNSTCRLAMANHMFLRKPRFPILRSVFLSLDLLPSFLSTLASPFILLSTFPTLWMVVFLSSVKR